MIKLLSPIDTNEDTWPVTCGLPRLTEAEKTRRATEETARLERVALFNAKRKSDVKSPVRIDHARTAPPVQEMADSMIEADSLPWEAVNACIRVAVSYSDFLRAVVRDNVHAAAKGLFVIDAYVNPDGREADGSKKCKTYPTDVAPVDAKRLVRSLRTLGTLAARVCTDAEALETVERAATARLAELANLDRSLWGAWTTSEKAHLSGHEAALLDIDGTAWTKSRKGHVTEIRYRDDAQAFTRAAKTDQGYIQTHSFSERDLLN